MNNIVFEKNLSYLKEFHPEEFENYIKSFSENLPCENIGLIENPDKIPIPAYIKTKTLMYDYHKPFDVLENQIKSAEKKGYYYVFGFGAGYHIKTLKKLIPNCLIIAFENNIELFDVVMKNIELSDILSDYSFKLLLKPNGEEDVILRLEKKFGGIIISNNISIINFDRDPAYIAINDLLTGKTKIKNKNIEFLKQIETNILTLKKFGDCWTKNIIDNAERYLKSPSLKKFYSLFEAIPCILAAGGPSLDNDIENIIKLKNKILIICVDTALKNFLKKGVEPDIIVSVNISKENLKYLQNAECGSVLICDIAMPESITKNFEGRTVFVHYGHSIAEWLDLQKIETDKTAGMGSVTAVALDVANKLFCNPVFLAGTDFAYSYYREHCSEADFTKNAFLLNKYMSFETVFFNKMICNENPLIIENLLTNERFIGWKFWFESQIEVLKTKCDVNFFNVSHSGLEIRNAKRIKSSQIFNNADTGFPKTDFSKTLKRVFEKKTINGLERSARLNKPVFDSQIIIEAQNLIETIKKNISRIEKKPESKNADYFVSTSVNLINKLFYGIKISKILRWSTYIFEIEFREIDCSDKQKSAIKISDLLKKYGDLLKKF